ncbi:MAG: hypothetical protein MJZ32_10600 [Bacteroidaceae bacterium]|nr:hypothetical protein [Bacteroidaceae bacterium]
MEKVYILQHHLHYVEEEGYVSDVYTDVFGTLEKGYNQIFSTYENYLSDGWQLDEETAVDEDDNGLLKRYDLIFIQSNGITKNLELTLFEKEVINNSSIL